MPSWLTRSVAALCLYLFLAGCVSLPSIRHPGTESYQRNQATLHDPYSDNDVAPEVVGGRPREFQKPLAEPVRNQLYHDSWWSR